MRPYDFVEMALLQLFSLGQRKPYLPVDEAPKDFLIGDKATTQEAVVAADEELRRHLLLVGATGCGKTTLILRLFDYQVQQWQS